MSERPLNLPCRLALMGTDVRTGGTENDTVRLKPGVAAAALVDLGLRRRIAVVDGALVVLDRHRTHDRVLDVALNDIAHPRRRGPVDAWMSNAEGLVGREVHDELRRRGLIGPGGRPASWFSGPRYRVTRPVVVEELRADAARSFYGASAGQEAELLLALACACGLDRVLLPRASAGDLTVHLAALQDREAREGTTGGVLPVAVTAVVLGWRLGGSA